jgi:DHA2 family multidrug resistance protein
LRLSEQRVINPWIVAIAVMFSTFMEVLDTTVVNVSLEHIAGDLSSTIDEATWALTSYLVANAIILPITGWLASYFGRKRLLMMSVVGFTISSFLCGFAPSLAFLVVCRILQGAAGGCLQPLSQAILLEAFPPDQRGKAMGFWGLGIVVAPVLGPVLGGWLTDSYSWRWVFYINIPVGIASIIMTQLFVFDPPYLRRAKTKVDFWGIGFLAVWIGALQIAMDKGEQDDWFQSHFIVGLIIVTVIFLAVFLIREFTAEHPVVDLRVFKYRTYSAGVVLMTVTGFVLYGSLVLLPIWIQTLLGYPALQAGIALAPRGMGSMLGMPLVGALMPKMDPRRFLAAGLCLAAATLWQFSTLSLDTGYWNLFWPQFIQGFSLALLFVPLTTISMSPISREKMGNATSIFNLTRNMGGSIGIAMVQTLQSRFTQRHTSYLTSHITPFDPAAANLIDQMSAQMGRPRALASLFGMVQAQAAMLSFVDVFRMLALLFLAMVPLLLIMKRPQRGAAAEMSH